MWAKLTEIVEARWDRCPEPRHDLAKAINTLYGAMHNCHIAFQRFENERGDEDFANLGFAIDALISTLRNLHPSLQIFDAELSDRLTRYALGTDRIAAMSHPRELVKSQIRFLRELVRSESTVIGLPEEEFAAFGDALERMRRFICARLGMDEIFGPP